MQEHVLLDFDPALTLQFASGMMSAGGSSKSVRSEDELGEKWDRCIADSILKTGKPTKLWSIVFLILMKGPHLIPIDAHLVCDRES